LQRQYPIVKIVVDGANKQGVEEIKNRHKIPLKSAEKTAKATYLRLLRDDIIESKVLIIENSSNELITEWSQLQWKDENKQDEDSRCQNHLSDSTLYAWRECRHYTFDEGMKPKHQDSDEYMDELEDKEAEEARQEAEKESDWWGIAA